MFFQCFFLLLSSLPIPFSYEDNYSIGKISPVSEIIPTTALFLLEPPSTERYLTHFFHLLEHLLGLWCFYGDAHFQDVQWIVLKTSENWEGPNQINFHLLRALFPAASIKTWSELSSQNPIFKRALISDRARTFESPECAKINKMLAIARHSLSKSALQHMAQKVYAYANVEPQRSPLLRVTYLKRSPPRALSSQLENLLFQQMESLPNAVLRVEDFAHLSFQKQIEIIANTDLLIGVHGNGLSHLLFLPETAQVIELFPPNAHALDYRLFAEIRGIRYCGIIANRGVISKEKAYEIGAFGEINTPIEQLDLSLILKAIR